MKITNRFRRIMSVLLLVITLIGVMPLETYASANSMNAKMISFFQSGQENIEMSEISESELRVYGVFLSNFFTPGETRILDLSKKNENDNKLAEDISKIFFGNAGNSSRVGELNDLIYEGIKGSVRGGQLFDSNENAITGKKLFSLMTEKGKLYDKNKQVVIDLSSDVFRGVFKILAAQSAGFMFNEEYGVAAMTGFYLDAFGNIWGSYEVTIVEGEAETVGETPTDKLVLVLPACLNPISFLNTSEKNLNNIKLPLNNSFAMGSLVDSDKISETIITDEEVPYYNIPKYFGEGDKENALFIYGINSPFNNISNTNRISERAEEILKASSNDKEVAVAKMRSELENELSSFYSNNNYSYVDNYKLMLGNRVDVVQKSLESGKTLFGDSSKHDLFRYFFDSMLIDLDKTYSTIYYFGEGGNASWANSTFDSLSMVGVNMFGSKQENGKWLIHDSNQKLPKIAENLSLSRDDLTIDGIRKKVGVDFTKKPTSFTINSSAFSTIDTRMITAINTSIFGGFGNYSSLGKGYYIQGLDSKNDSEIYDRLVDIVNNNLGNFSFKAYPEGLLGNEINAMKENILYLNLHVYTVSGAKFKAEKTRTTNIEVFKTDSNPKTFVVTNNRVGTVANWPGIFWGYMVEMLDMEDMVSYGEDGKPFYDLRSFESRYLPELPAGLVSGRGISLTPLDAESGVSNSENLTFEETQKDLIKKIYGIISDGPNPYRDSWLKATLDGFIINTHRAITGSWISNIATVSSENESSYNGVVGYIHTPSLYDLPFTSWFMNNYMEIYILCLLIVLIITIAMVLLSMRTWKSGVLIFFVMSVCLMLPNVLIENTINYSNKAADSIYSDRFDFWAVTQHQQSIRRLKGAVDIGAMDSIIQYNAEKANTVYSQEAGVRIKWMSPKKTSMFNSMFTNGNMSDKLATNLTIFKWLFSSFVYQQEFVSNDPFATYIYRPYNAIASDANEYYKLAVDNIADKNKERVAYDVEFSNKDNDEQVYEVNIPENIRFVYENLNTSYAERYKDDFYGAAVWGDKELLKKDNIFKIYWSNERYNDVTEKTSQYMGSATDDLVQKRKSVSLWGLGNEDVTKIITQNGSLTDSSGPDILLLEDNPKSPSPDTVELLGFYKHTESPFYYFYNTLKYRYNDDFKNALLKRDTFVVTDGKLDSTDRSASNKVRDFLDLEGLFTNIIPYMTMSNDYVYGWTNVHGTSVPDYDFSRADDSNNPTYTELKQLKTGMQKVWSMYSPWVDQLNSLDVHNQRVGIAGKRVRVENTLNPSYYLKAGRPMIFSEADMIAKGYTQKELSDVERRLQRVLDTTYTDLQYLVNYYDMEDEVLVTVAAMYATFNFNREFSQNEVIGESVMLYPQGFEMKNFNYDAFMRLVMLNSTGETIFAENGDLYNRILSKTSFFTGLMLLITDVLGVIIIPTMKIIILLLLLFLGLLLCLTCVVCPPEKLFKSISNSLLTPAILFLVANVIFAFVVSLLVGEGLTSYVGSKGIAITTNDPTITIGIMIIINAIYCIALFKIVKILFNNCKSFGITTLQVGTGIIAGAALSGLKKVANSTKQVGNTVGGAAVGTAMAGKGNRLKGAMDGAVTGSKGGSVFQERRREQRMAEEQSRFNITDEINRKASGKGKIEEKPDASNISKAVKSEGLQKEKYSEDGNKLGNKVEDVVYTKNKVQDNVNRVKHNIVNRKEDVVDKINTGYEDTKQKVQENIKTVQIKAQKTKSTAKDIISGKYFNDALEQGVEKDKIYRTKRQELDSQRSKPSKRFNEEMDKMRKKGVNDTKGGKHNG